MHVYEGVYPLVNAISRLREVTRDFNFDGANILL